MHSSNVSTHGMAVAPHHLASQSALAILREGGSAIEAMVLPRRPSRRLSPYEWPRRRWLLADRAA